MKKLLLLAIILSAGVACDRHDPAVTIPGFAEKQQAKSAESAEAPTEQRREFFPGRPIE